jgi:hypothetical protein
MTLVTERWCAEPAAGGSIRDARQLSATIDRVETLGERAIGAMFDLYDQYYDATSRPLFEADLRNKDYVVTLREPSGALAGFSTLAVLEAEIGGKPPARDLFRRHHHRSCPLGHAGARVHLIRSPARSRRRRRSCRSTGS